MSVTGSTEDAGLVGREAERQTVTRLLEDARNGHGRAMLVRGEAGSGKTTLLLWALACAGAMDAVWVGGAETEVTLAFAGLAQAVAPFAHLIDEIPSQQAMALRGALALGPPAAVDPFAVHSAAMSLFTNAASKRPVLALVDDCAWVDPASLSALTFVARRVDRDAVAMLFAEGSDDETMVGRVLADVLELTPIETTTARLLLRRGSPDLAAAVEDRLLHVAAGNALALTELPGTLTLDERTGRAPLPDPLPASGRLGKAFGRRLDRLSASGRAALAVVAAADVEQAAVVESALAELQVDTAGLDELERCGLVDRAAEVRFVHPIARSVAYERADPRERRAAHRALARAHKDGAPDRRAWHAARGAESADEAIAAELEAVGERARARTGHAEAAAAFEEAARLSTVEDRKAARLLASAASWLMCGRRERTVAVLALVSQLSLDPVAALEAHQLEARALLYSGDLLGAHAKLTEAARAIEVVSSELASLTLSEATFACHSGGLVRLATETSEAAYRLAPPSETAMLVATVALAGTRYLAGEQRNALELLDTVWPALEAADPLGSLHLVQAPVLMLSYAERFDQARSLLAKVLDAARSHGAAQPLCLALVASAQLEFRAGNWPRGLAAASEAARLSEETGQHPVLFYALCAAAQFDAVHGRERECRARVDRAFAMAQAFMGDAAYVVRGYPLAMLLLPRSKHDAVIDLLEPVHRDAVERGVMDTTIWPWHGDLFEAYVRTGRRDDARRFLSAYEHHARASGIATQCAVIDRCYALLCETTELDELFARALAWHRRGRSRFEEARTNLAYGERLSRAGRRVDARTPLRSALSAFEQLGAPLWAGMATRELQATGERHHRTGVFDTEGRLTPRELEVALAVADGQTNQQVATSLFLSLKTVEFHLRSIYRKLGIRSRSELARLVGEQDERFVTRSITI